MLERCYSAALHIKRPSYLGCTVCSEWLKFSEFKLWMEKQDHEGNCLDKDLLVMGNKHYCPESCIFVSVSVNSFITDRTRSRGKYPIGAHLHSSGRFLSQISPLGHGSLYLGLYDTPEEASLVYKAKKLELAKILAESQIDRRIGDALIKRYTEE